MKRHATILRRIITPVFLLSIILSSLGYQVVSALDEGFFSSSEIYFTDPDACSASVSASSSNLEGNDNLEKILRYFTGKGLSLAQAAGIAGNMQQESGLDPTIIQGGGKAPNNYQPVNGVGFGLVQWTFTGRQSGLVKFAQDPPARPITDMSMQLGYVWKELEGPYKQTLDQLKKATNPVDAAIIVHGPPYPGYEASADTPEAVRRVRGGNAQRFYDQYKGKITDGVGSTPSGTSPSGGCTGGPASNFSDNGFVIYNQYDARWAGKPYGSSTIGEAGCGPSSMAMIITALTGKPITPADTTAYANLKGLYIPGVGSSWDVAPVLAEHWGLKSKKIQKTVVVVNEVLKAGGLVVTSGSGAAPFTGDGHYITIRGVTESGKWKIGDSNGNVGIANSQKEWDPQQILDVANADNVVAITK